MTHLSERDIVRIAPGGSVLRAPDPGEGNVRFLAADGSTTVLLQGNGKIFIRGEQVDDNQEVYAAFVEFLNQTMGLSLPTPARAVQIEDPGPSRYDFPPEEGS